MTNIDGSGNVQGHIIQEEEGMRRDVKQEEGRGRRGRSIDDEREEEGRYREDKRKEGGVWRGREGQIEGKREGWRGESSRRKRAGDSTKHQIRWKRPSEKIQSHRGTKKAAADIRDRGQEGEGRGMTIRQRMEGATRQRQEQLQAGKFRVDLSHADKGSVSGIRHKGRE
eukprot:CAMPEP_0184674518 /NCGR_PEP_ID=MMETSP0308-20130426/87281_1 /TAXON_ID=38269 /ORGANISM="Gloeochaete witrockiana, Strain SAG 46.84" /LENGTH=168 /DNA_ID=CAMNT_0027122127 /DNA_START=1358 /DNA_END=1864 /DNA_ORIENTATION=-